MTFYNTMQILSNLCSLTVSLQKRDNDILAAYEHILDIVLEIELLKTNCEFRFDEVKTLADNLRISVCTPRTALRHMHRTNVPAEVYYRRNVMMPFSDHTTNEMQARFGPNHQT